MTKKETKKIKVGPTTVLVDCPNGHDFELAVDTRDYNGLSSDARHHGVVCSVCDERLSVRLAEIHAAATEEADRVPIEAVDLEEARAALPTPDPAYLRQPEPRTPHTEKKRKKYTEEEIAALRAAGPGNGGT